MESTKYDLITVLGPTATGKTSFAAHLAYKLGTEIISADSRQIYRGMDLGTGKDIADYTIEGEMIPYHLVDIVDAGYKYNVFEYQSDFLKAYLEIKKRGLSPIFCGGSGMYIESVLKGYKLINVPVNEVLREELEPFSLEELTQRLASMKRLHNKTDVDTKKRVIRAIEIEMYYQANPETDYSFPEIKSILFGISFDRYLVKRRITQRLEQRLNEGMIEEVEKLMKSGIAVNDLIYYGLEYKFITQYLIGQITKKELFEQLNIAIHQFSKRQMTWFRKMEREGFNINWIDGNLPMEEKVNYALNFLM